MTLTKDLEELTKSLRDGSAGNPKSSDGAPPDEANVLPPPLAGIPPVPFTAGTKPRLVETLSKDPSELSQETLQLMEDSKGDDEDAQDELHAWQWTHQWGCT